VQKIGVVSHLCWALSQLTHVAPEQVKFCQFYFFSMPQDLLRDIMPYFVTGLAGLKFIAELCINYMKKLFQVFFYL